MRRQADEEVHGVAEAAEREAAGIVENARSVARSRLHKAVQAMRVERRAALQKANAQLHAAERRRRYDTEAAVLEKAMVELRHALAERWKDEDKRRLWCLTVAGEARDRLNPGNWTMEHPKDWQPDKNRELVDALTKLCGKKPEFVSDPEIEAGIRIRGDHSCIDSTLDGLLVRRIWVEAALLSLLNDKVLAEAS
ncbi:MAG: hypothetical protein LJE67_09995 [Salaquimonas sp.]|nr:hypothetical protein [Salaquimonas sp.]